MNMTSDMDNNGLGSRLKKVRKKLGLTQNQLGNHVGVSGASISEIEAGKYKPCHDFFFRIVKEFNVSLYYLMFDEGEMFLNMGETIKFTYENGSANTEEFEKFFDDFNRSPLLQHLILEHYYFIIHNKKEPLEMELKASEEKD